MLELILCSSVTLLPDFLYRRFVQGKRIGVEITLYSVWYELRYGIVTCLMLTTALITVVFYNHPATSSVSLVYRTVPIVPETNGRVAEIFVGVSDEVKQGEPIFRLDSRVQDAALDTARTRVKEIDAAMTVAQSDIAAAEGQVQQAQGAYQQAQDELDTKQELYKRNPDVVARRELERLQNRVDAQQGALDAAKAMKEAAVVKLSTLLPAQKDSAMAALAQAEVEVARTVIKAGVDGRVEQFGLKVGDVVNPFARPAGVLIPKGAGPRTLIAGFDQVEAQVMRAGMIAEAGCISQPWTVIPLVVTSVQDYIAAGQFRGGDQLVDIQQFAKPGTLLVYMEPLYKGGLDDVTPGSSCIANAYSNHHDEIVSGKLSFFEKLGLHVVDAVGLVHAMLLRIQVAILPIKTLVFSGGH